MKKMNEETDFDLHGKGDEVSEGPAEGVSEDHFLFHRQLVGHREKEEETKSKERKGKKNEKKFFKKKDKEEKRRRKEEELEGFCRFVPSPSGLHLFSFLSFLLPFSLFAP